VLQFFIFISLFELIWGHCGLRV